MPVVDASGCPNNSSVQIILGGEKGDHLPRKLVTIQAPHGITKAAGTGLARQDVVRHQRGSMLVGQPALNSLLKETKGLSPLQRTGLCR
jgi:hypothetical protein